MNKLAEQLKADRIAKARFRCTKCSVLLTYQTTLNCNCGGQIVPMKGAVK